MDDSRVKSVSDLLSSFFDEETARRGRSYAEFSGAWKAIAGARLGAHSRPADVRHGILIVECEHQGWMQLLHFQGERILKEAAARHPELELRGIAFTLANAAEAPEAPEPGVRPLDSAANPPGENRKETENQREDPQETPANTARLPGALAESFARIRRNLDGN